MLNETTLSLPGGVTVSVRSSTVSVWSHPDLHGDDVVSTDGSGVRPSGPIAIYDPFGNPINLGTGTIGVIGTVGANSQDLGYTTTAGAS